MTANAADHSVRKTTRHAARIHDTLQDENPMTHHPQTRRPLGIAKLRPADLEAWERFLQAPGEPRVAVALAYVEAVSSRWPALAPIVIRDVLARISIAGGALRDLVLGPGVRFDPIVVPVAAIGKYSGIVPADDPARIDVLGSPDGKPPPPPKVSEPSEEWLRYLHDMLEADSDSPCPLLARKHSNGNGVVVAGGVCLNELFLGEDERAATNVRLRVPVRTSSQAEFDPVWADREYRLKGPPGSDTDLFLVVNKSVVGAVARRRIAKKIVQDTLDAVLPERFCGTDADVCELCKLFIGPGGKYAKCFGSRMHVFHQDCFEATRMANEVEAGVTCPCLGCKSVVNTHRAVHPGVKVCTSRSTCNVMRSSTTDSEVSGPRPCVQVTSRVYETATDVVGGFDLAPSGVWFDGAHMWATELAAFCIANRVLLITIFSMSNTCEQRVHKYLERYRMDLLVPGLTADGYAALDAKAVRGVCGLKYLLARLASGEKKMHPAAAWAAYGTAVRASRKQLVQLSKNLNFDVDSASLAVLFAAPFSKGRFFSVESLISSSHNDRAHGPDVVDDDDDDGRTRKALEAINGRCRQAEFGYCEAQRLLLRMTGLPAPLRLRIAAGAGTDVDMQTYDMINLMSYQLVEPGRQVFFQAQFDNMKLKREKQARGTGDAIEKYEMLWLGRGGPTLKFV